MFSHGNELVFCTSKYLKNLMQKYMDRASSLKRDIQTQTTNDPQTCHRGPSAQWSIHPFEFWCGRCCVRVSLLFILLLWQTEKNKQRLWVSAPHRRFPWLVMFSVSYKTWPQIIFWCTSLRFGWNIRTTYCCYCTSLGIILFVLRVLISYISFYAGNYRLTYMMYRASKSSINRQH